MKILLIAVAVCFFIGFILVAQAPATSSDAIKPFQEQVAQDFVQQYEMVKVEGSDVDRCVRAGLVAEGYLQAENNEQYSQWRAIQKADCTAAGMAF